MPGFDAKCACCVVYREALTTWRLKGGEMPKNLCTTEHRATCKKCGEYQEGRAGLLCDSCYEAHGGKPKIKRFNPLDLVRGGGPKRVI